MIDPADVLDPRDHAAAQRLADEAPPVSDQAAARLIALLGDRSTASPSPLAA